MARAEGNTRRIVFLGKSGTGKSSLANTMFGEKDTFKVSVSAKSTTRFCKSETRTIHGRNIQLIDTPGFFDTDFKGEELKSEVLKCLVECAPGPHSFLLVFPLGRFTPQEEAIVDLIEKEYFGEEALKYTTVVFTRGDDLPEGMKIEDWLKDNEDNKPLKNLVDKCGGRCCVIDNKYWNKDQEDPYRNNQYQIKELLKKIEQTVKKNSGGCYSNEMLEMVQKKIEEKKAEIKQSSPNISEKSLLEKAKEAVLNVLKSNLRGAEIGAILGAFFGGAAGAGVALSLGAGLVVTCVEPGVGAAIGAAVGTVGGAVVSEYAEPLAEAAKDAVAERADLFKKALKHHKYE